MIRWWAGTLTILLASTAVSCANPPPAAVSSSGFIGTATPTPTPPATIAYLSGLSADGTATPEPTPTPTPSPTPTPTPLPPTPMPTTAPPPPPPPPPVVTVHQTAIGTGAQYVESLLAQVGWPVETRAAAISIVRCESGFNPGATGSAGERGLFQIHPIHHDSTYDPVGNVFAALRISGGGYNFSAWSCRP